jgi:hypothetical protein
MPIAAEALEEQLRKVNPQAIVLDGFEAAVLGTVQTHNGVVIAYDYEAMLALMEAKGMSAKDARAYGEEMLLPFDEGEGTPVFVRRLDGTHD